ncbi:hypothetical protein SRABI06_01856 [Pseudomonas brassicacearum]|nr:hypothetical protein SRABI06_01856 [Pseudomonas brassicacearum]
MRKQDLPGWIAYRYCQAMNLSQIAPSTTTTTAKAGREVS